MSSDRRVTPEQAECAVFGHTLDIDAKGAITCAICNFNVGNLKAPELLLGGKEAVCVNNPTATEVFIKGAFFKPEEI
jgi:hypothetical protein